MTFAIPDTGFPPPPEWWDLIDGKIKFNNTASKVYWVGGDIIGMSSEFLESCDRDFVKFKNDVPKIGDYIDVDQFQVRVVAREDNYSLILCERVRE